MFTYLDSSLVGLLRLSSLIVTPNKVFSPTNSPSGARNNNMTPFFFCYYHQTALHQGHFSLCTGTPMSNIAFWVFLQLRAPATVYTISQYHYKFLWCLLFAVIINAVLYIDKKIHILFYSILSYPVLFSSLLFSSILFSSILFYSILFYYIEFYSILFYSILFYSISILFYSVLLKIAEINNFLLLSEHSVLDILRQMALPVPPFTWAEQGRWGEVWSVQCSSWLLGVGVEPRLVSWELARGRAAVPHRLSGKFRCTVTVYTLVCNFVCTL